MDRPVYCGCIVDGPYILLNEISQTETKYCYVFIYLWSQKQNTTDTENRLLVARGGVWVVGQMDEGSQEVKISIHNKN